MGLMEEKIKRILNVFFVNRPTKGGITVTHEVEVKKSSSSKSNRVKGTLFLKATTSWGEKFETGITYESPAELRNHAQWMTQVAKEMLKLASAMEDHQ